MLKEFLEEAFLLSDRYADNPTVMTDLLNDQFGAALRVYGIGRIVAANGSTLALSIHGRSSGLAQNPAVSATARSLEVNLEVLKKTDAESAAAQLTEALSSFVLDGDGAHLWIVPDGFMADLTEQEQVWAKEGGGYFSHEALCVQNTGQRAAQCELFIYFEEVGRQVLRHQFEVAANCSNHLRLDKIEGNSKEPFIPKSSPVGYKVVSYDEPIVVQGSRILTSGKGSEFGSFGTVMAWTPRG